MSRSGEPACKRTQQKADEDHAGERGGASLPELVDRWPVGQAVFAAIAAVSQLAVSQKIAATMIAAAARGAVQGSAGGIVSRDGEQTCPVIAQEMVLHALGVKNHTQAQELLRRNGENDLAKRVSRQSKTRNGVSHPDVGLLSLLEAFMARKSKERGGTEGCHVAAAAEHFDIASNAGDAQCMEKNMDTSGSTSIGSDVAVAMTGCQKWCDVMSSDCGISEEENRKACDHSVARRWNDTDDSSDVLPCDVSVWHTPASKSEVKVAKAFNDTFGIVLNVADHPSLAWHPKPLLQSADNSVTTRSLCDEVIVGDSTDSDEDYEDPVTEAFVDALIDTFTGPAMNAASLRMTAKGHLAVFLRASFERGDDKASSRRAGLDIMRGVFEAMKDKDKR